MVISTSKDERRDRANLVLEESKEDQFFTFHFFSSFWLS
jgi:hypothetical protein